MHDILKLIGVVIGFLLLGHGLNQDGGSGAASIIFGILFLLSPLELLGGFTVYFVVIGAFLGIMIGCMAIGAILIGGKFGILLGFAGGAFSFYKLTDLIGPPGGQNSREEE